MSAGGGDPVSGFRVWGLGFGVWGLGFQCISPDIAAFIVFLASVLAMSILGRT